MDISKLPRLSQTPAPPGSGEAPPAAEAGAPATASPTAAPKWCLQCHAPNPSGTRFCGSCGAELGAGAPVSPVAVQPGIGAEVWVSAIVGIVMMLLGMNFARWAITTLAGGTYQTNATWQVGERAGQSVNYWDLEGFVALQDTAFFLFGLAMVLEAVALVVVHSRVRPKRPLLAFALSITIAATALNLLVAVRLFGVGIMPLMSLLAVGFGGYIAAYEWRLYQHFGRGARA